MICNLIADEIEKIKGFFYTKLKHDKNYPDLLKPCSISESEFKDGVSRLFWENPHTALTYSLRILSEVVRPSPNLLNDIFGPLISNIIEIFIQYREFLTYFLDYQTHSLQGDLNRVEAIMFWEMPFIPLILKYIDKEYDGYKLLGDFFAKMMLRINSNQLSFYLSQIFQSLDYSNSEIIENFIIKYCEGSPLFAHQVIWMSRVEEKSETEEESNQNQVKREVAAGLPMKIIRNMGIDEKNFWDEVDSFYEQITRISSLLTPQKGPKTPESIRLTSEKIRSELEKIKMPPLIYMPTNPDLKISEIKLDSGRMMQSAAKCPILVSFYCEKFEGPDKYFSDLRISKSNNVVRFDDPFDRRDMEENINMNIGEKINERSIVIREAMMIKDQSLLSNQGMRQQPSTARIEPPTTKLDILTEELFPFMDNKYKEMVPRVMVESPAKFTTVKKLNGQNYIFDAAPTPTTLNNREDVKRSGFVANSYNNIEERKKAETKETQKSIVSCIFKTRDDIRRDNLSLQIIRIFQEIFVVEKLDLFLFPYRTISTRTGNEKTIGGIIECVPKTQSRDEIGKVNKCSLYEHFKAKYGSEISLLFQKARENFIKSLAAYSVVSYILQIKDRHNGNIIIDEKGYLIHIDFGFIFDISPGKNLGFENAQFKLTT